MEALKVETMPCTRALQTMKITGFSDGELTELKAMPNPDAKEALLSMLDARNHGLGTTFLCGYGAYGLWFDNEAAYLNIGTSCD